MKTFDQYINEYLKQIDFFSKGYFSEFAFKEYGNIPFEFKWGLFKFICDDLNINFMDVYRTLKNGIPRKSKLHGICPIEFINQIIEL